MRTKTYQALYNMATGELLEMYTDVKTHRGDEFVLVGCQPPRSPVSTGRVEVVQKGDPDGTAVTYYPGVIGAEWRDHPLPDMNTMAAMTIAAIRRHDEHYDEVRGDYEAGEHHLKHDTTQPELIEQYVERVLGQR